MRAVVTVTGTDRRGIIAQVSTLLFERDVNIVDISQSVLSDQFAMIMIAETPEQCDFLALKEELEGFGERNGLSVRLQHADLFDAMHNV